MQFTTFDFDGEWIQQTLMVGNKSVLLQKIKNIDALYEKLLNLPKESEFHKDERIPYWAELWPSSIGLGNFIIEHSHLFIKKNVLEIACGLALPSVVVASYCHSLILADYEADALKIANENMKINGIDSTKISSEIVDWRAFPIDLYNKFEVVLASDIVYEKRAFEPVFHLFSNMLLKGKTIYFAEPNRAQSKDFILKLQSLKNVNIEKNNVQVRYYNRDLVISIYEIKSS